MFDVVVIGGGPSGATAAEDLARSGHHVALLDREGRIKPCGGAIPPRLIEDFAIPSSQIVARINTARMISPTQRKVDIPIENGFVGMVDREHFDPFLRRRSQGAGATWLTGTFLRIERDADHPTVIYRDKDSGEERRLACKVIIGADGARSKVAKSEVPNGDKIPYVIAYHEIIEAPLEGMSYDPKRCDVIYDGAISPDFYGWVFPHGKSASVGMGTGIEGVDLKKATAELRAAHGLSDCKTIRREGAPIPLRPLDCWDNGTDVVLAGDAAGVVAPSSGEGIYYAMVGGRVAATAASCCGFTASSSASPRQAAAGSVPTARPGWAAANRWAEASLATTACTRSRGTRPLAMSGNSKAWAMRPRPITPKVSGEKVLNRETSAREACWMPDQPTLNS